MLKHDPHEVKAYGRCAAFILAQLRYWHKDGKRKLVDGWACFTLDQWADQITYSKRGIQKAFDRLVDIGLVVKQQNVGRNTPGYRLALSATQDGTECHAEPGTECHAPIAKVPCTKVESAMQDGTECHVRNINVLEKEEELRETPPTPPAGDAAASRRSANRKAPAEPEAKYLLLVRRLTEIIDLASVKAGLSAEPQKSDEAALLLQRFVAEGKIQANEIEVMARWMFTSDAKFQLANMRFIHRWGKKWNSGRTAFEDTRDKWRLSLQPDAPRTQQSRPGRVMPQEVKISDDIPGVI